MRKKRRSGRFKFKELLPPKPVILWVVGRMYQSGWEFQGVFDSEERAMADVKSPDYFLAPAELNKAAPETTTPWPGLRFPYLESPGVDGESK